MGAGWPMASVARCSWDFHRFGQLQQVVNGADQAPFALRLLDAAQHELAEPSSLFDLAEDRLNDRLAQPVPAAPTGPSQLGAHRRHPGTLADAAATSSARLMMALAPGGNVAIHMMAREDGEVALGAISGIGGELLRLPSGVLFDLLQSL